VPWYCELLKANPTHTPAQKPLVVHYRVLESETIPERLRAVFDHENSFVARLSALEEMSRRGVRSDETQALLQMLHYSAAQNGLPADENHAFKNDVANVLKSAPVETDVLADHLMAMYQDDNETAVWQDYCIQHLGSIYSGMSSHRRSYAKRLLRRATENETGAIAGTSLLALYHNTQSGLFDPEWVRDRAVDMAQSDSVKTATRVTALQVGVALNDERTAEIARNIIANHDDVQLRMSALAVLGRQGTPDDISILRKHAASSDIRIRTAARAALEQVYRNQEKEAKSIRS
jgi:hypothetical protein